MSESGTSVSVRRLRAAVITVSDSTHAGTRQDLSGPAVAGVLASLGFEITGIVVVPDEEPLIRAAMLKACLQAELVATTGGTGVGPRDFTPEATRAVCERFLDGIPERMRREGEKTSPHAVLSRALCGARGQTLILNLPGSPNGAVESLQAVAGLLPHALELLSGQTSHADPSSRQ